jgi:hypothetical protein
LKPDNAEIDNSTQNLGLKQVKCDNGILVFRNQEHFQNVKNELAQLSYEQFVDWEKSLGFLSMNHLYRDILDAEETLANSYDNMSSEKIQELENSGKIYEYSDLAQFYLKKGFIEIIKYNDIELLQLKCFADYNSKVLNEEGLVKIGNEIWQFTENQIKILKNGDFNKLDLLKETKTEKDYVHIIDINLSTTFKTYTIDKDWSDENSYDRKKIVAASRFIQYYTNSSHTIFHTKFWAHIVLYKYSWHKWRTRKDGAQIRGWYKWDDGTGVKTSYETHDFSGNSFYSYVYIDSYSSVSAWVHAPKIVSTHLKYSRYGGDHGIHVWCYNFSTGRLF